MGLSSCTPVSRTYNVASVTLIVCNVCMHTTYACVIESTVVVAVHNACTKPASCKSASTTLPLHATRFLLNQSANLPHQKLSIPNLLLSLCACHALQAQHEHRVHWPCRLNSLLWYNAWPEHHTTLVWEKRFRWIGKWLLCIRSTDTLETRSAQNASPVFTVVTRRCHLDCACSCTSILPIEACTVHASQLQQVHHAGVVESEPLM